MTTLTISLAQIDIVLGQPASNLVRGEAWVAEAARRGSDLILLPELWTSGYSLEQAAALAEDVPQGNTARTLAAWARRYGLWIAGSFLIHTAAGARLILVPSEWPHPRLAHWRTLLRARAIENQLFVAAANRVGADRANRFCGHAAIIDPWGETIVEGSEEESLLTATIDLKQVDDVRAQMPVLADRRPDCYRLPP